MSRRLPAVVAASLGAVAIVALLGGCTGDPGPERTASGSASARPTPSASTGDEPQLILDGTAAENQRYFDSVNRALIAAGGDLGGRAFVDNLVAKGFTKADMEVTPDKTSIGLDADNITFSVKINGGCLIGEHGNVGYASQATTVLGTGRCLVGTTRPIDW